MKNLSILFLSVIMLFSMELYAKEKPIINKKTNISFVKESSIENDISVSINNIKQLLIRETGIEPDIHITIEYGILCHATVSGTTADGITYTISGSCRAVKRMLKKIGAI